MSPRDLADAIGVSESSLKRWADSGRIAVVRTEGGHRRIPVTEAVRFIRETGQRVVRPELLGLPDDPSATPTDGEALYDALARGDGRATRAMLLGRYLHGEGVAAICDGPMRTAMTRLGELWKEQEDGVFIEHRATDLCIQALAQIRALIEVPADGPVALGGAASGDQHLLPSFMAAAVLAAEGWNAVNLGADTPATAIAHAILAHHPRLVWLSVTNPITAEVGRSLGKLIDGELASGRAVVIGGRHASRVPVKQAGLFTAGTMGELAAYARGLARTTGS